MTRQTLFVLSGLLLAGLSSWAADEPVQACAAIADDAECGADGDHAGPERNLGHGILPPTKVSAARALVDEVHRE